MSFIDDPDYEGDFPDDPDDYESQGYQELDPDGRYIIELFTQIGLEPSDDYLTELIEDLIVNGGLAAFGQDLEDYGDYFLPLENLPKDSLRQNIFASAEDAYNYLERIPGFQGFAGMTWVNGAWRIWVGETQTIPLGK